MGITIWRYYIKVHFSRNSEYTIPFGMWNFIENTQILWGSRNVWKFVYRCFNYFIISCGNKKVAYIQCMPPTDNTCTSYIWNSFDFIFILISCNRSIIIKQVTWLVVTEVRSESFRLITEGRHYNGRHMLLCVFIVACGIARFICAMRVFEIRASFSPLGYLYGKFSFCRGLHCWAISHGEKSRTQSLNLSLTQLIWCVANPSFLFGRSSKFYRPTNNNV